MNTTTKMPPNPALMQAMQETRRSSAASKHKNKTRYNRTDAKRQMSKEY